MVDYYVMKTEHTVIGYCVRAKTFEACYDIVHRELRNDVQQSRPTTRTSNDLSVFGDGHLGM